MIDKPKTALPAGDVWALVFIAVEAALYISGGVWWMFVVAALLVVVAFGAASLVNGPRDL
jgi:hypothetical protein